MFIARTKLYLIALYVKFYDTWLAACFPFAVVNLMLVIFEGSHVTMSDLPVFAPYLALPIVAAFDDEATVNRRLEALAIGRSRHRQRNEAMVYGILFAIYNIFVFVGMPHSALHGSMRLWVYLVGLAVFVMAYLFRPYNFYRMQR